jgi:hypothetical protein
VRRGRCRCRQEQGVVDFCDSGQHGLTDGGTPRRSPPPSPQTGASVQFPAQPGTCTWPRVTVTTVGGAGGVQPSS